MGGGIASFFEERLEGEEGDERKGKTRYLPACNICCHTVDGRNPAPVDIENVPCFIQFHIRITGG